jgi:hypothetical protein
VKAFAINTKDGHIVILSPLKRHKNSSSQSCFGRDCFFKAGNLNLLKCYPRLFFFFL